ncbi:hypothetical protein GALL_353280 [mine drainage metagenome]|uniref:Uncharacterized protein n=1 Tax=mine drainage metagenome TaxID=410659 RepID=A0A1J5QSN8_9ZZZZ
MAVYDALEAIRRIGLRPSWRLLDPCHLGERIVFVGATSGHFASTVSVEHLRRLNPLLASHLRSVSFLQPLGSLVAELDALQPTIVAAYPSAAVLLAEERQAGRLGISPREILDRRRDPDAGDARLRRAGLQLPDCQQLRRRGIFRVGVAVPMRSPALEQRLGHPRAR